MLIRSLSYLQQNLSNDCFLPLSHYRTQALHLSSADQGRPLSLVTAFNSDNVSSAIAEERRPGEARCPGT